MRAPATMTRTWPMLAALGGGLVGTALAAGAGGATQVVLAGLGVAALGWGVLSLRAGRELAPRTVLAVSVATLLLAGAAVASGSMTDVPGLPLAAACVFLAAVALSVAPAARRARAAQAEPEASAPSPTPTHAVPAQPEASAVSRTTAARRTPARPSPTAEARRSLAGLAIGAVLVSALATPALAATEAGRSAVPHGEHGTQTVDAPTEPAHHH
ncbi:hypothetical protein [Agromyces sp. GXQ0307]|uniref:hypothetical protein n=1 Tax=Agromyces sp. GXQ0307 TaxID=3377835 RepID=UPI00383B42CE